jgi:polysaccharide pyruvyl transferase WcaK-like protein
VEAAHTRYLTAFRNAIAAFQKEHSVFTILVAMERLDTRSCRRLSEMLGGVPVLTSDQYDMYQLVSILRCCHLMVSSRYHGIVTAMPALVPSAGVTMDERIRNLMHERGHQHLLMKVDDPDLEDKLLAALNRLRVEGEAIRESIGRTVAKNIKVMARMGVYFEEHLQRRYTDFPERKSLHSWEDYLPPLSPGLRKLLEKHST